MSTRLTEDARGVYVIAATPFAENGAVDFPSIDRLVEFYIGEGVHGMTVLGIMGEAPKLTDSEQTAVLARYLKRIDGRVPVIVGVSNPGIDNLAQHRGRGHKAHQGEHEGDAERGHQKNGRLHGRDTTILPIAAFASIQAWASWMSSNRNTRSSGIR